MVNIEQIVRPNDVERFVTHMSPNEDHAIAVNYATVDVKRWFRETPTQTIGWVASLEHEPVASV